MNDLKFAFRQLLKNPGFTAVAVLTLALGIGANTAIFILVNAVLLRPMAVQKPEEIVSISASTGPTGPSESSSYWIILSFATAAATCSRASQRSAVFHRRFISAE